MLKLTFYTFSCRSCLSGTLWVQKGVSLFCLEHFAVHGKAWQSQFGAKCQEWNACSNIYAHKITGFLKQLNQSNLCFLLVYLGLVPVRLLFSSSSVSGILIVVGISPAAHLRPCVGRDFLSPQIWQSPVNRLFILAEEKHSSLTAETFHTMDVIYQKKRTSQENLCTFLETLLVSLFQRKTKLVMEMLKCSVAHGSLPGAQSWCKK